VEKMWRIAVFSVVLVLTSQNVFCSKLDVIKHVQSEKSGSLQSDLNEFLNIIPIEDIRNLTEYFYGNDKTMRDSYDYLRTDGYKLVVESISSLTMVKKFSAFLNDTGVNFAELGKRIEKIVLTDEEAKSIVGNCSNIIAFRGCSEGANLLFSFPSISQRERRRFGRLQRIFQ
jgi:hypothetical protein